MIESPLRILHFADLHVGMERYGKIDPATGLNGRVMDFLRRLSDIISYAVDQDVDMVIFAGDAYKNRDPNSTYRREFSWRIKELADRGIPIVMVPGNHDLPAVSARASSIEVFDTLGVPNVYVLDREQLVTLQTKRGDPVQIAAVPYPLISELVSNEEYRGVSLEALDHLVSRKLVEVIESFGDRAKQQPAIPAILIGHFSVDNAELGSERGVMVGRDVVVPRSAVADPVWDYVALGHVHKHQDINKKGHPPVVYSGSVERIDFGEAREPKGWVLAQVSRGHTTYEFITHYQHEARRFVTIDRDLREEQDPTEAVIRAIQTRDVADAIVRVRLQLRTDQDALLNERVMRAALSECYTLAGIIKEIDWGTRSRLGAVNVEAMAPLELLERYFHVSSVPEVQAEQLLKEAEGIVREVEAGS